MNTKQKALAIKSVAADCDGTGFFYNRDDGKTCAVGGMAKSMGYIFPPSSRDGYVDMQTQVEEFYGIDNETLWGITKVNDFHKEDIIARRAAVIEFIESLPLED